MASWGEHRSGSTPGSDRQRSTVYTGITIVHHEGQGNIMASWGEHRSGRHLSIQVPAEIKIQLIKNKALTGVPIGYQICEALRARWSGSGASPAVVPGPKQATQRIVPDRYAGMRQQKIDRTSLPWKV